MASKTEDHGAENIRRLAAPLPIVQSLRQQKYQVIQGKTEQDRVKNAHNLAHIEGIVGFLPIRPKSKAPMISFKNKEYLKLDKCLSYGPAAIAIRSDNIGGLDLDHLRGLEYLANRGINFMDETWHIRRTSNHERFKLLYLLTGEMAAEIGPCTSAKQDYQGSGIDVFPKAAPYIIISGEHEKDGYYYWPEGDVVNLDRSSSDHWKHEPPFDVTALAPPSPEVLELLIEANQSRSTPKRTRSSNSCEGKWKPALPCPICNRDKDDDCRTNRAGDVILCHRGNTFHPPTMKLGEIISGTQWAYCGSGEDCTGTFSTFIIHRPSKIQSIKRKLAGVD